MSESDDKSGSAVPASPLDDDLEDMTRAQLRGYIAREVGKRTNWETPFDKDTLNSIHAYLTGSYYVSKRVLHKPDHPDWASRKAILCAVVFRSPIGEPDDEWSQSEDSSPGELRWSELRTLAERVDSQESELLSGGSDG